MSKSFMDLCRTAVKDEQARKGKKRRSASWKHVCATPHCSKTVYALGLCRTCYHRLHPRLRVDIDLTQDPELYAVLRRQARQKGCSVSELVRNLCKNSVGISKN